MPNGARACRGCAPASRCSVAQVEVGLAASAPGFGLVALIDAIEAALATPVQTAVKRADEQAFAQLNGSNLMFVEDAVRRVRAALANRHPDAAVRVEHQESLHPHDAVAWG